jgi:glycosyltransferase involved in cell wall biosynthesis
MTADAVGGVWSYAAELVSALAGRGCEIHLVTMGPPPPAEKLLARAGITLEVTDLALEWLDPAGADVARACGRLAAIARRFKPDIVHVNGYREALVEWNAPVLIAAHSCVRSWWQSCRGGDPVGAEWQTYVRVVTAAFEAAPWVAPTYAFRDQIAALYSPNRPGHAIWNGIALAQPAEAKEPFILAAGRIWDEAKNITVLDCAACCLEWPIKVAGPVAMAGDPETRMSPHFERLGVLPHGELQAMMRRAAIFASPARYEPFGLAVLEAARAGCALVLGDIPTFRELWNGAALFAEPGDAKGFQAILHRLCRDDGLRCRLGEAAARRSRLYSVAAMAKSYLEAYHALCSPPNRQRRSSQFGAAVGMHP